jgi:hypothetical protein
MRLGNCMIGFGTLFRRIVNANITTFIRSHNAKLV